MSETELSRRSILKSLPVVAVAASAAFPAIAHTDPIFAAIERHKEAHKAYFKHDDLTDEEAAAEHAACEELLETIPTSKEGIRAVLEWLITYEAGMAPEACGKFLPTLLKSPVLAQGGMHV